MDAQELWKKLETVADRKGYFLAWGKPEGCWLTWREPTEQRLQNLFSTYFQPFEVLRPDPFGNCPYPLTSFQYNRIVIPEEERSRKRELYERLSKQLKERTPDDKQFVATQASALENRVRHSANRLRKPLSQVKKILKVWFAETEEVITESDEDLDLGSFYFSVYLVWEAMKNGRERAAIENYDFCKYGTPLGLLSQ